MIGHAFVFVGFSHSSLPINGSSARRGSLLFYSNKLTHFESHFSINTPPTIVKSIHAQFTINLETFGGLIDSYLSLLTMSWQNEAPCIVSKDELGDFEEDEMRVNGRNSIERRIESGAFSKGVVETILVK